MLLSFLYNYLAPFPHFPLLTFQTEPPKLHPNPYASVKYIEFEEKKVSFILSQPALAPSCRDQRLLGLSKTFCVCLWSRKQPLFQAGVPSNILVPSSFRSKQHEWQLHEAQALILEDPEGSLQQQGI